LPFYILPNPVVRSRHGARRRIEQADVPDDSPEANAFFIAHQSAIVHNAQQQQPTAARNRPVGTFGTGKKMVGGSLSAHDIDRGSIKK
jgi:hypothetical protein